MPENVHSVEQWPVGRLLPYAANAPVVRSYLLRRLFEALRLRQSASRA